MALGAEAVLAVLAVVAHRLPAVLAVLA